MGERFFPAVVVSVRKSSPHWQAGSELVSYIQANRADAILQEDDSSPVDKILVRVGSKPRSALLTPVLDERERSPLVEREKAKREQMERSRKDWRLPPYDK